MICNRVQLRSIVDLLKTLFHPKLLPKFAWRTVCLLGTCMGRVIRCHKDFVTKRLQRKIQNLHRCRNKYRINRSKCNCAKCKYRAAQKDRVLDSDFLASLAYNHRICDKNGSCSVVDRTCIPNAYEDVTLASKDVPTVACGETWWTTMQQRYMPPLYEKTCKPTKSDYSSSASRFRSRTPDNRSEASCEMLKKKSLNSGVSNTRSCPNGHIKFEQCRQGWESDPTSLATFQKPFDALLKKSASMKTFYLRKTSKDQRSLGAVKRRMEKRHIARRVTSHAKDCFSTGVRCSGILSKPY